MKKCSSSSTSSAYSTNSTSTTTASVDESLDTPRNHSRSGCISTMLLRILGRKLLATHPSDHDKYTEFSASEKAKCSIDESIPSEASGTPNLVAKLMGLDSIPIGNLQRDISRSRSMNAAESWKGFEDMKIRPRRTKSFREIPSFLDLEDENFFILSFENVRKNRSMASKGKKSEKGFTETEKLRDGGGKVLEKMKTINKNRGISKFNRREKVYEKNKENMIVKLNCSQKGGFETVLQDKTNVQDQKGTIDSGKKLVVELWEPLSKKKDSVRGKTRIKKRKDDCLTVKTVEPEINSQNSSPDSVLEDVQLPVSGNTKYSELSSRLTGSTTRRTLWEELENYRKQNNPGDVETLISNNQEAKVNKQYGNISSNIVDFESKFRVKILKSSSKVTEDEMLKSKWILKDAWKLEDYVNVGEILEAGIFDQMIDELIDQLTDI